ncbi:SEC-C metal-binding domain-containing protein [Desulfoluna spongiiphila]|uniref:SEC-C motif-containing protein n=1 Tax=Desulfoluna spongiiphila TaxID=419481 RepID=A0A1G5J8T5_9BACT|nr:SEC-C metal-binding domain-containing protein [Desulfoluna spongiiphila]SCY84351.1 SEC-C motif-containing protein [Desulfoluna spongiiphila]
MAFTPAIVPNFISAELKKACLKVAGHEETCFLEIQHSDKYIINKCAYNAMVEADAVGGRVVFGWAISIWENVAFDFIGHAVVELNDKYYCVTPTIRDDKRVLFLKDDSITFDYGNPNCRLPSCEVAISKRPEVEKFLKLRARIREIKLKYPVSSGLISVSVEDGQEISALERQEIELLDRINYALHPVKAQCPCGSGKQFRKCCRPHMKKAFS